MFRRDEPAVVDECVRSTYITRLNPNCGVDSIVEQVHQNENEGNTVELKQFCFDLVSKFL